MHSAGHSRRSGFEFGLLALACVVYALGKVLTTGLLVIKSGDHLSGVIEHVMPLVIVAFPFTAVLLALEFLFSAYLAMRLRLEARQRRAASVRTPINAEFLLYVFMSPEHCDALVGDLEERHRLIRKKFGQRRANFWYWTQVFVSLRPIIWAWVKKVSGVVAMIEAYRRMRS